ncbi:regulator of G-protein signaling 6-like protein [Lates japonicus]|uniref:Regulator of G-protein signaling 6-like protein n=1 Tax=Lates japonicus TaxID=270547 RepID=A0AAD3MZU2_LATJO|nr:regulator of G-protein signaling 6-like protein [Lates japonicus]
MMNEQWRKEESEEYAGMAQRDAVCLGFLLYGEQPWPQPAAGVKKWENYSLEAHRRTRQDGTSSQVPGVRVQQAGFWLAVQDLKRRPLQDVPSRAQEIWQEFLAEGAPSSINLDSHSYGRTMNLSPGRYNSEGRSGPNEASNAMNRLFGRFTMDSSRFKEHIFKLMKSDSYARFLRSNIYQDLLLARKKQPADTEQGRRTSLEKFTRSVGKSLTGKRLTGLMQSS